MATKKRTREQIEADKKRLDEELAGMEDETEDDDNEHVIVFRGNKGLAAFLKALEADTEEQESGEDGNEEEDQDDNQNSEDESEEESEEEETEGEESEDNPPATKSKGSKKSPAKKNAAPPVVKDATPKARSKWFGDK